MSNERYGFIGLGNMGKPMAANLAKAGYGLVCYDIAGTEDRAPAGAAIAATVGEVARKAEIAIISVDSRKAIDAVTEEIAATSDPTVTTVVDTSTIGSETSRRAHERLAAAGIAYIDSPVAGASGGSGIGPAAAAAASLTFIVAGKDEAVARVRPALENLGQKFFHVGQEPGQAQAVKLINNFLIATAMAATAEAMLYGQNQNLDMKAILEVINVSSGQNIATSYIFPKAVEPQTYDMGAAVHIMTKDVGIYHEEIDAAGLPKAMGDTVNKIWRDAKQQMADADFSRIFEFIRDGGEG